MRSLVFAVTALFFSCCTFSQVGGNSTYQFLTLVGSPRQAALGGNNITNFDYDVNQAILNPATINPEMHNQLSLNFGRFYGDISHGSASYSRTLKNERNFHVGVTYLNYGTMDGYDDQGRETGTFTGNDVAVSVGYGHHFTGTNFHVGTNIRLISSVLESYNSFGVSADIAGMYVDKESGWNVALVFRNIGTQLFTYNEVREPLPFETVFGVSKLLENVPVRWHFTLDQLQKWNVSFSNPNRASTDLDGTVTEESVGFFNNALRHVTLGIEVFPERKFNLRLAYNFRRGEEMRIIEQRHFSGLSAGFGFVYRRFRFDYSYARYTLAANTSLFGVSVKL